LIFFEKDKLDSEISKIIDSYKIDELSYSLTLEKKKESCFALLFAIFLCDLTSNTNLIFQDKTKTSDKLIENFFKFSRNRNIFDKSYLQLLTLTLSALYIVDGDNINFKEKFIKKVESNEINVFDYLKKFRCLEGKPSSGNYAMFLAIILIYLDKFLIVDKQKEIDEWVNLHLSNMNIYGFWGKNKNLYAYFQNGYHQYEIFKYLKTNDTPINIASRSVINLMNNYGGFAPYPGGGACYDYDAIFFLTFQKKNKLISKDILNLILENFRKNYFKNLGFSENTYCRPLNFSNFYKLLTHPLNKIDQRSSEKFLSSVSLLRKKNEMIKNHFSDNPYYWNKPNLFATWFRVLSIAKIETQMDIYKKWKFIKFPGIGF
jgi:hypothetical protein